ncbi:MAG: hypothetical protein F6K35_33155 [Okeania sp. SIO2H7]|nr:hypothetical protein [Okeania sp. SIO2H7]
MFASCCVGFLLAHIRIYRLAIAIAATANDKIHIIQVLKQLNYGSPTPGHHIQRDPVR